MVESTNQDDGVFEAHPPIKKHLLERTEDAKNHLKEYFANVEKNKEKSIPLNIVVVGNSGMGKSTTVNNLLDEIDGRAEIGESGESCTKEVFKFVGSLCGRKINLYDTPGFADSHGMSNEYIMCLIMDKIIFSSPTRTIDAFIIVDSIGDSRSYSDKITKDIKTVFGPDAAKKIIILMTKGESSIQNK